MTFNTAPALRQVTVLEATWTDLPEDVADEIGNKMWPNYGYGNDVYYHMWNSEFETKDYPIIAKYLSDHGIDQCLIHYWW